MKMKRIFKPYWEWEDYLNGMYEVRHGADQEYLTALAFDLLGDCIRFRKACNGLIDNWPVSVQVNLSNVKCNRRAWLGQAACCYVHSVPEIFTRNAWKMLTNNQRISANEVAGEVIREYEKECREIHRDMGEARLF